MKKAARLLPLCLVFFLIGCIEFDEFVQLGADGKVDFTLTVLIPELPDKKNDEKSRDMEREIKEALRAMGGSAHLTGRGEETKYGKQRVWFSAQLPTLRSLGDLYSGLSKVSDKEAREDKKPGRDAIDHVFSQRSIYRVEKTKHGNLKISREFKPEKKKKAKKSNKKSDELSQNMEAVMMNSMTFRFEFFSPTEVLSSNATGTFGRLLRWDASLGYLSEHPFKMEMEIASTPELEAALLKK